MQTENPKDNQNSPSQLQALLPSIEELNYISLNPTRYCIKTGKPLDIIPFNEVKELISIHGFDRAEIAQ